MTLVRAITRREGMSKPVDSGNLNQPVNLIYVRAAVEAATGIEVPLDKLKQYLVQEGLITAYDARHKCPVFSGYGPFFADEDFSVEKTPFDLRDDDFRSG